MSTVALTPYRAHGITLEFELDRTTVLAVETRSQTHVYSTGGSHGYGPGNMGYVAPVISSTVSNHQQIWYREGSGVERCLQLTNHDLPIRQGHEIGLLWARRDNQKTLPLVAICNYSTGELRALRNGAQIGQMLGFRALGFGPYVLAVVRAFLASVIAAGLLELVPLAEHRAVAPYVFLATTAYFIYAIAATHRRAGDLAQSISEHIARIGRETFVQHRT